MDEKMRWISSLLFSSAVFAAIPSFADTEFCSSGECAQCSDDCLGALVGAYKSGKDEKEIRRVARGVCSSDCIKVISDIVESRTNVARKQRGSGEHSAGVILDEKGTLRVCPSGELKGTRGKGAWTRIRNAKIRIEKISGLTNQVKVTTSGDWRNGSRHAHWMGRFTLKITDLDGRNQVIHLVEESRKTGTSVATAEYQEMQWNSISDVPDDFWEWVATFETTAIIEVALWRIDR